MSNARNVTIDSTVYWTDKIVYFEDLTSSREVVLVGGQIVSTTTTAAALLALLPDFMTGTQTSGDTIYFNPSNIENVKVVGSNTEIYYPGKKIVLTDTGIYNDISLNNSVDLELTATGTISSAEILALNATPITLIAAPGANKAIIVDEIRLFLDYNSATYVAGAGEDLSIQYSGGTVIAEIDNDAVAFLTATADAQWLGQPSAVYAVSAAASGDGVLLSTIDNESVDVTILVGEVATGDSPINYVIRYRIIDYLT